MRLGEGDSGAAELPGWSQDWQRSPQIGMLEAALEESEARASALDLENARLRLALVRHSPLWLAPLYASCGGQGVLVWHILPKGWRTRASGWHWCGALPFWWQQSHPHGLGRRRWGDTFLPAVGSSGV